MIRAFTPVFAGYCETHRWSFRAAMPGWVSLSLNPSCEEALACSHKPNTYSIDAVEVYLSSGELAMTAPGCLEPTRTAMYCLPLTE
jgi:hypothetical protein